MPASRHASSRLVVPAKAGTHASEYCQTWIPAFAGMTNNKKARIHQQALQFAGIQVHQILNFRGTNGMSCFLKFRCIAIF